MLTVNVELENIDAIVVADGLAKQFVEDKIKEYKSLGKDMELTVGTTVIFNWFRVAIKSEVLDHSDVRFRYPFGELEVLSNGKVFSCPDDFPDPLEESLMILL